MGVFPYALVGIFKTKHTRKQFCKTFLSGRPQISLLRPPQSPPRPRILACVWPSLATAGFQSSRPWSGSELECPARKGAPWRPPERPRHGVAWGVGVGGGPDRLMRTPNAPQPGPLIASRLAGSEPGPPPGSINSPSLQMAAGSSLASRFTGDWGGGSRWRTPTLPHWGKEAPAAAPPSCSVRDTGPEGAVEVEPIAWRRETKAQKEQGMVQGRWWTET